MEESEGGGKRAKMSTWKLVKVYECPDCGEWVRDMCDACNHVCREDQMQEMKE